MSGTVAERLIAAGMSEPEARAKAVSFGELERQLPASKSQAMRWFVPGRIEVLGKHTDYAGGRSLLCATERGFCVAAVSREDNVVQITDALRGQGCKFSITAELPIPDSAWRLYPAIVARRLARNFPGELRGADIALVSDLPPAAGMSSSSSLVVAMYTVLSTLNGLSERDEYRANIINNEDLAGYLGCIENGQTFKSLTGDAGVGTFGGSEDHTAILCSEPQCLKQYSFCPVRLEQTLPFPGDCAFVIGVSGVVADKTGSANARYNQASQGVRSILELWRGASGSKAATLAEAGSSSPDSSDKIRSMLRDAVGKDANSAWLLDRFEQFWKESEEIIPRASAALLRNDLRGFGELVQKSQFAAESLLRNQVPETIWLAEAALSLGAYAASAFGAGFGGSVWALVPCAEAAQFARSWQKMYECSSHMAAASSKFFVTSAGPSLVRLSN